MAGRLSTGLQNRLAGITTELNTNYAFTANISDWTAATATAAFDATNGVGSSGCLSLTGSAGSASKNLTFLKPGQVYKVSFSYKNAGGAHAGVSVGTTATGVDLFAKELLADAAAHTTRTIIFTAPTTCTDYDAYLVFWHDGTSTQYFDNVSITCMSHSIQDCMKYSMIKFYSGSQPADPDTGATGTLLCTVTNGTDVGVQWDDATDGVIAKKSGETWTGVCGNSGTVGWFRVCTYGDTDTNTSTTECRIDGTVATSGGEINFPSLSFVTSATQTVTDLTLTVKYQA